MATARKVAALIKELETEEQWEELMQLSEKKLIMIDAYKDWCGPCEVMAPTYERIYLDNEECEKRMEFRTCDAAKIPALSEFAESQSCKPLFLFYKDKALIGKVSGANAPEVVSMVADNIPEVPEE